MPTHAARSPHERMALQRPPTAPLHLPTAERVKQEQLLRGVREGTREGAPCRRGGAPPSRRLPRPDGGGSAPPPPLTRWVPEPQRPTHSDTGIAQRPPRPAPPTQGPRGGEPARWRSARGQTGKLQSAVRRRFKSYNPAQSNPRPADNDAPVRPRPLHRAARGRSAGGRRKAAAPRVAGRRPPAPGARARRRQPPPPPPPPPPPLPPPLRGRRCRRGPCRDGDARRGAAQRGGARQEGQEAAPREARARRGGARRRRGQQQVRARARLHRLRDPREGAAGARGLARGAQRPV
jgi:hypothetical protein